MWALRFARRRRACPACRSRTSWAAWWRSTPASSCELLQRRRLELDRCAACRITRLTQDGWRSPPRRLLRVGEPAVERGAALRAAALRGRGVLAQADEHTGVRVRLHAAEVQHQLLEAAPQRVALQLRARGRARVSVIAWK
jgi:hypothetical protein